MKMNDFTMVPNKLIRDKSLSNSEFRVFVLLKSYKKGENGKVFPSHSTLAKNLGVCKRTIEGCLSSLKRKGFTSWKKRGYSISNEYEIHDEKYFDINDDKYGDTEPKNISLQSGKYLQPSNIIDKNSNNNNDNEDFINKIQSWFNRVSFSCGSSEIIRNTILKAINKVGLVRLEETFQRLAVSPTNPNPRVFWENLMKISKTGY